MPVHSSNTLRRVVIGFWGLNLITGLIILGAWFWKNPPKVALLNISSQTATVTSRFPPTFTLSLTSTISPTETAPPTYTPTNTPSPIPFSEGPISIGQSVQGRPLDVYRFGTGPIERLIVAGMHGGSEYNTIQLADELMTFIRDHPALIPSNVSLYILHDLNPDGEARAHVTNGRANANGVDLNRNWDANWQKTWPRTGCWPAPISSGTGPASEPETRALAAFILGHHFDALINYHSAALGIFPGGLPPGENSISLAKAIAAVTKYPYPPITNGCVVTGGFTDWADINGVPAVDIELTNHTHTDYEINLLVLTVFLNWKP
jgi:hypothetical protein